MSTSISDGHAEFTTPHPAPPCPNADNKQHTFHHCPGLQIFLAYCCASFDGPAHFGSYLKKKPHWVKFIQLLWYSSLML